MAREYTDQEKRKALVQLVWHGSAQRASEATGITPSTIKRWKKTQLYEDVRREEYPKLQERIADDLDELLRREIELEAAHIQKAHEEIPNLKGKEATSALRDASVTKGVTFDKTRLARGEPTQISAVEKIEAIKEKWARRGIEIVSTIEGTATEEPPPAELPTGQTDDDD